MTRGSDQTRWLLSFVDLLLLMLAFFVLLHAQRADPVAVVDSIGDAFAPAPRRAAIERRLGADEIFTPGEAILRPEARARLDRMARGWAQRRGTISITSLGHDGDAARFEAWELAAARAAALGRLFRAAGVDARAIEIAMPARPGDSGGQRLTLRFTPAR